MKTTAPKAGDKPAGHLSQADEALRRVLARPADTAARPLPTATGPRRRAMQVRGV